MPESKPAAKSLIAACVFEIDAQGGAPTEAHLLPPGPFKAMDGRPYECEAWQLDAAIAARVIALAKSRKNDIGLFYEHQDFYARFNGQRAEACGWCPRTLEWRDGLGLYATGITWVGDTADLIKARKYRYISALFTYSPETGEVLELLSIALTNTPALDGLDALADLARQFSDAVAHHQEEAGMPTPQETVVALTAERDGLTAKVATLTTERDGLKTSVADLTRERDELKGKVAGLEQEKAAAALAADKAKHADLLAAALTDGRLTPAQKPWAEKQTLAALTEYLEATKPLPLADGKQSDGNDKGGGHGLTQDELAMCSRMGVSPEDFKKAKA